ncbi:MAG: hypothetical protein Q7S98_07085 [Deltaproteobacteria bacterium]|nr:hypothetical protein [Deltaproteobacteria bacterium]
MNPRERRLFSKILFLSLLASTSFAATYDPSTRWSTIKTDHFKLHFYEGEEKVAQKAAGYLEEAYQKLGEKFGLWLRGRIQVVVMDNNDAANGFATVLPYNEILLRVVSPLAGSTLAHYDNWLRELVFHEYTHILHLNDVGYPMKLAKVLLGQMVSPNALTPMWVSEGIATFFETEMTNAGRGRSSFAEMLVRTDILRGKFLHLDRMAGTQYDWPGYLSGYIYGVKFWQYLGDRYGKEKMIEFSHRYGASPLLFSLGSKAYRSYGKTFKTLWREWKEGLEKKYAGQKEILEKEGLQEGELVVTGAETTLHPSLSPDGKQLITLETSVHRPAALMSLDLATGEKKKLSVRKFNPSAVRFDPLSPRVAFSEMRIFKRYSSFQDLYLMDLSSLKSEPLTDGKRARDPDFSPDGKRLVFVLQETGHSSLASIDLDSKEISILYEGEEERQFDTPRFSPDGQRVAVVEWWHAKRSIVIFELTQKSFLQVTDDDAQNNSPAWSSDGQHLFFSSDRSGISNLYRYSLKTKKIEKITNVLTGAFESTVSPDGTVYFQYYNGKGYEIRKIPVGAPLFVSPMIKNPENPASSTSAPNSYPVKKYSPLSSSLLPHYLQPNLLFLDGALFATAAIGSNDPLERHFWFANGTYRTDAAFAGFGAGYSYNRWTPSLFTGATRYAVNYGNIFGVGGDYFEQRLRGYGGVRLPLTATQQVSLTYLFENRDNFSTIPVGMVTPSEGNYAGLHLAYNWSSQKSYPASISVEKGYRISTNFMVTDPLLGADANLQQELFWGDGRLYLPLPWQHHVIALRSAGGIALGKKFVQGNFGLGGSIGEGLLSGVSSRVFTLRGLPLVTFSRDRAMVVSAEYRVPLFRIQRGIATTPLFMNSAHLGLFADYGDAWNDNQKTGGLTDFFDRFLLGVGAELRGDFVVGYHLPVTGRLGYGILALNRDRVGHLVDPITGREIRNGILILELGTSF